MILIFNIFTLTVDVVFAPSGILPIDGNPDDWSGRRVRMPLICSRSLVMAPVIDETERIRKKNQLFTNCIKRKGGNKVRQIAVCVVANGYS